MFSRRKKARPELVHFGDLSADHFARHPVWIGVHGVDDEEPWYIDGFLSSEELGGTPVDDR